MRAITVFCASSEELDERFHAVADEVGRAIAERGVTLVYGGGCVGLMGRIAQACRSHGGGVVGIITHTLVKLERADRRCDELIVVDTMRERKRLMAERGEAFLVLPGGIGTYEEFFEVLVGRKLGEHAKPIGVVNVHGAFDPLAAMLEHGMANRFIGREIGDLLFMHEDPAVVVEHLLKSHARVVQRPGNIETHPTEVVVGSVSRPTALA